MRHEDHIAATRTALRSLQGRTIAEAVLEIDADDGCDELELRTTDGLQVILKVVVTDRNGRGLRLDEC